MQVSFNGALVVTQPWISRVASTLMAAAPSMTWRGGITCRDGVVRTFLDPAAMGTFGNARAEAVHALMFVGQGEKAMVQFFVTRGTPTAVLTTSECSREEDASLRIAFDKEMVNARSFYSPATKLVAWLYSGWRQPVALILAIVLMFFPTFDQGARNLFGSPPTQVSSVVGSAAPTSGSRPSPDSDTLRWPPFWRGLLAFLTGIALLFVMTNLFPSVVFAFGEGQNRYDSVIRWRWLVLSGVILRIVVGKVFG